MGYILSFTRFYGFKWVLVGYIEFYMVLQSFNGFEWVSTGFIGFYRVSTGSTASLRTKVVYISSFTRFYWVLLGFTGFYWVLPGFTGL